MDSDTLPSSVATVKDLHALTRGNCHETIKVILGRLDARGRAAALAAVDAEDNTVLYVACLLGHYDIVNTLCEFGATDDPLRVCHVNVCYK